MDVAFHFPSTITHTHTQHISWRPHKSLRVCELHLNDLHIVTSFISSCAFPSQEKFVIFFLSPLDYFHLFLLWF